MAARTPNVVPRPIVIRSAVPPSSALTLSSRMTSGVIGSPRIWNETPRLPWIALMKKLQYCTRIGLSSPY
jgi:hypothetical protein